MPESLKKQIHDVYGHRIRLRACGCLVHEGKILMLRHREIGELGYFWNVPGGEPLAKESLKKAVEREFWEEAKLEVKAGKFLCLQEYIAPPLHAVEIYFEVSAENNEASLGFDPENVPLLDELRWFDSTEFDALPNQAKPLFLRKIIGF